MSQPKSREMVETMPMVIRYRPGLCPLSFFLSYSQRRGKHIFDLRYFLILLATDQLQRFIPQRIINIKIVAWFVAWAAKFRELCQQVGAAYLRGCVLANRVRPRGEVKMLYHSRGGVAKWLERRATTERRGPGLNLGWVQRATYNWARWGKVTCRET